MKEDLKWRQKNTKARPNLGTLSLNTRALQLAGITEGDDIPEAFQADGHYESIKAYLATTREDNEQKSEEIINEEERTFEAKMAELLAHTTRESTNLTSIQSFWPLEDVYPISYAKTQVKESYEL